MFTVNEKSSRRWGTFTRADVYVVHVQAAAAAVLSEQASQHVLLAQQEAAARMQV